jgi:hypothetical protein
VGGRRSRCRTRECPVLARAGRRRGGGQDRRGAPRTPACRPRGTPETSTRAVGYCLPLRPRRLRLFAPAQFPRRR